MYKKKTRCNKRKIPDSLEWNGMEFRGQNIISPIFFPVRQSGRRSEVNYEMKEMSRETRSPWDEDTDSYIRFCIFFFC